MHDFDKARIERAERDKQTAKEREFRIGGEKFTWRPGVRPEALSDLALIKAGKRDKEGNLLRDADGEIVDAGTPMNESIAIIDGIIVDMIESSDDAHTRWRELRSRQDDPITLDDMQAVVQWLVEQQTGRTPTPPRSRSGSGRGGTGTRSTVGSSSQVTTTA